MLLKTKSKKPVSGLVFLFTTLCIAYLAWPSRIGPAPVFSSIDSGSLSKSNTPRWNVTKSKTKSWPYSKPRIEFPTVRIVKAPRYSQTSPLIIDINAADSIQWVQIPGIGPKTAKRILERRRKLRGFVSPQQLLEVYYFDSNLLQSDRIRFKLLEQTWTGIFWDSLKSAKDMYHPYLNSQQRYSLWAYKTQHPEFHPRYCERPLCIDSHTWIKMKPYWR